MPTSVARLAEVVHGDLHGEGERLIHGAQPVDQAGPNDLTYAADEENVRKLRQCRAGAVLINRDLVGSLSPDATPPAWIVVEDAQSAFIELMLQIRPQRASPKVGISPEAIVRCTAQLGGNCDVYPGAYIGENVVIGDNCQLYPGVFVGPDCKLGDNVVLHPNVTLYPGVSLGDRVTIHANAVVGADGFGYRFKDGRYHKIPHLGSVRIHEDVEIGAGTTIDRGMIADTIIGAGTKIDNLVMIAHNCSIGRHNVFASQVGIAGSASTGDHVRCGGQAGISDHVHLGEGCSLGARAGVHKSVPAGQVYIGIPAGPETEQRKTVMALKRLPDMRRQVRELESRVVELTSLLQALMSGTAPD